MSDLKRREFITLLGGAAARGRSGARAAARASAAHRRAHEFGRGRSRRTGRNAGIRCRRCGIGLDRRPKHADRKSLDCGDAERIRRYAGRIGRACAGRHVGHRRGGHGGIAAGNPHGADRIRARSRSGRCRLRRELRAAGRQCDRIYAVRIRHEREMAGTAQRDRPSVMRAGVIRDASQPPGSASSPEFRLWRPRWEWR